MEDLNRIKDVLVSGVLKKQGLWAHQIDTYDKFVNEGLGCIIADTPPIDVSVGTRRLLVSFGRVTIFPPMNKESDGSFRYITPYECSMRRLNYQVGVCTDMEQKMFDRGKLTSHIIYREVPICKLPCMVRSSVCSIRNEPPDHKTDELGGYFVINGHEKTTQAQIKLRVNTPFVHKGASRHMFYCEVRSVNESLWKTTSSLRVIIKSTGAVTVSVRSFSEEVPIKIFLRMLGYSKDFEISYSFEDLMKKWGDTVDAPQEEPEDTEGELFFLDCATKYTKERTPDRRIAELEKAINKEVLPHLGTEGCLLSRQRKIVFVTMMLSLCLKKHKESKLNKTTKEDDRDHWRHKRIDACGTLIAMLFRQLWRNFIRSLQAAIQKPFETNSTIRIIDFVNPRKLETGIRYHFSTGIWTVMRGSDPNSANGVCQQILRMSNNAVWSALRKINCPVNRQGKTVLPRMLHISDWGNVCCTETPEGHGCGLILNLPLLTHVRPGTSTNVVCLAMRAIIQSYMISSDPNFIPTWMGSISSETCLLFINGTIWGIALMSGEECRASLREARRHKQLPFDASIVFFKNLNCVHVNTDSGACVRPLIVASSLETLKRTVSRFNEPYLDPELIWDAAYAAGCIEWVDCEEQDAHCVIKANYDDDDLEGYTHLEVNSAAAIMGIAANLIPFSSYNQSPRNIYQAAMGKQAIQGITRISKSRPDSHIYEMWYVQKSFNRTLISKLLEGDPKLSLKEPSLVPSQLESPSTTFEVCILVASMGFNQEDAIVIKKGSIDRGMGVAFVYRTYGDEINAKGNDEEVFGRVTNCISMKNADYSKIEEDGLPAVGTVLEVGDVVIGKSSQTMQLGPDGRHLPLTFCRSTVAKEHGLVDNVWVSTNRDGKKIVKVRVRTTRRPIVGDKFATRCAQKGTIGLIVQDSDMPYSENTGMTPDIVINPHAFVSRMTMAMLIEMICGKAAALCGEFVDASPFQNTDPVKHAEDVLLRRGFQKSGNETFIDGCTGTRVKSNMFMGIGSYQRLKHLAEEKIHSRSTGARHILTNQPLEGRGKGGGLRMGEMERDGLISHGTSEIIKDRMFKNSDVCKVTVCETCGLLAEQKHSRQFAFGLLRGEKAYCRNCDSNNCREIEIPSAQKLFMHEINCFNSAIRLRIADS